MADKDRLEGVLERFSSRKIVMVSPDNVYLEPLPVPKVEKQDRLDLENVWSRIQWYKAWCFEGYGKAEESTRRDLLLKIMDTPSLAMLAGVVENQTGTDGLTEAFLESYTWASWELYVGSRDVGEAILSEPNVSFSVKTGEIGSVASLFSIREYKTDPQVKIYDKNQEWTDYEFGYIPKFDIQEVGILKGKKIRFEGLPMDDWHDKHDLLQKEFASYILSLEGSIGTDIRKRYDNKYIFNQMRGKSTGPTVIPEGYFGKPYDQEKVISLITNHQLADRALATFLLPYVDAPSISGIHYVLPESVSNRM